MDFEVRVASPQSYPLDPRYEQTRYPLSSIRPAVRVFQHHERDASRLLQLPDEILWVIVQFVAQENQGRYLSQFALVRRECRQLAQPYQFADVWITRSELSWTFLRHLRNEKAGELVAPIGSLIRSLTIIVDRDYHSSWGFDPRGLDPKASNRIEAWEESWSGILSDLAHVIQSSTPNLDQLHWLDTGELDPHSDIIPDLLQAVLQRCCLEGGLRKLYFEDYGFIFDESEQAQPIIRHFPRDPSLNLRDLALGYNRFTPKSSDPDGGTALFVETLLRRCASTLESYVWSSDFDGEYDGSGEAKIVFRNGPIAFQKLCKFWAYTEDSKIIDPAVIESFLSGPLESFAPSMHMCSVMLQNGLVERCPLPQLRTFAVTGQAEDIMQAQRAEYVDGVLKLGRSYGPQLEELFIYMQGDFGPNDPAVSQLVSHYASGSFSNLASLCFVWVDDPYLEVLQAIGSNLLALEELSFGFQPEDEQTAATDTLGLNFTCRLNCPPSHDDMLAAISPLQKLRRLAVFGDEYVADWAGERWAWHRFFKEHVWYHQGRSLIDRKIGPAPGEGQIWSEATRGHQRPGDKVEDWMTPWITETASPEEARSAVGDLAAKYAKTFPDLQEFMSGRVLVEITRR